MAPAMKISAGCRHPWPGPDVRYPDQQTPGHAVPTPTTGRKHRLANPLGSILSPKIPCQPRLVRASSRGSSGKAGFYTPTMPRPIRAHYKSHWGTSQTTAPARAPSDRQTLDSRPKCIAWGGKPASGAKALPQSALRRKRRPGRRPQDATASVATSVRQVGSGMTLIVALKISPDTPKPTSRCSK
ncbi:hypothetical protein Pla111_21090 [Botrimarina hoheduenensis]|uniref:Uncharacterized protein n=1 Tax=Botrimarina hoheduenensis TaxID=2528000 RepID=A0A5C5VZE5_9BACT|nr:hypothetical protein Pla111_21090 [Botrimarina hoheduenensis]